MSMQTYIKCGEVHTDGDEKIGLSGLKANQKRVNGSVSMLLKILNIGSKCQHEGRWRESTINQSLESCPLWLLYKCHKGWTWKKGTPPPTRGVMGGNQGMNSHLSEILSWALEPLADALLPKSSEVISNEDLKSKLDKANQRNAKWRPDDKLDGELGDVRSMMEAAMEMPGLCQCEECSAQPDQSGENIMVEPSAGDMYKDTTVVDVSGPTQLMGGQGSNLSQTLSDVDVKNDGQTVRVGGPTVGSVQGHNMTGDSHKDTLLPSVSSPTQSDQLGGQEFNPIQSDQMGGVLPDSSIKESSQTKRKSRNLAALMREEREKVKMQGLVDGHGSKIGWDGCPVQ